VNCRTNDRASGVHCQEFVKKKHRDMENPPAIETEGPRIDGRLSP